jgi:hypothetical protein
VGRREVREPNEAHLFVPQVKEDAASLIDQIEWLARTSNEQSKDDETPRSIVGR